MTTERGKRDALIRLLRQAALLLRQQGRLLKEGGVESMTLACAVCSWDLESRADVMDEEARVHDEQFEVEDTPVYGIKVKR